MLWHARRMARLIGSGSDAYRELKARAVSLGALTIVIPPFFSMID